LNGESIETKKFTSDMIHCSKAAVLNDKNLTVGIESSAFENIYIIENV